MLFWHQHNVEKSLADLPNFTPFPDEWTVEDRVLFEQAFSFHGKSFHRIQQMVLFHPTRTGPTLDKNVDHHLTTALSALPSSCQTDPCPAWFASTTPGRRAAVRPA